MRRQTSPWTVVVAAKAPHPGTVKTRLTPPLSANDAARLAGAFLQDTLATASSAAPQAVLALDGDPRATTSLPSGIRTIPQTGNSLGERLVSMLETAGAAPEHPVCIIGSDAPHLPAAFLREAWGRLRAGADVVLGPSDDGGYYLIGSRRPIPGLFEDVPWSTDKVLSVTRERAAAENLSVALLPPWYDVDTIDDLRRLREDIRRGVAVAPQTASVLETLTF